MEAVSALSAHLQDLPDVLADADADATVAMLDAAGCAHAAAAVRAGQRARGAILTDASADLMASRGKR